MEKLMVVVLTNASVSFYFDNYRDSKLLCIFELLAVV